MQQDSTKTMLLPMATIALLLALAMPNHLHAKVPSTDVTLLIANLEDEQFELRESATRQLVLLGPAAVEALAAAAIKGDAEVTWRAVFAIGEIAVAGDFDKRNTAEEVLEKLKSSPNLSAAYRAETILETLPESRQTRAITMLRSLGGVIDESGTQLLINEKWLGEDSGLRYVRHVAALRNVQIEPSATVTDDGIAKMKASLPDYVRVTQFGNAFLGVGAASNEDTPGMRVLTVQPDSPAGKAGIQEGDVIRTMDGKAISGFDDLVAIIRKKKVGDVIAIDYERPDEETGELKSHQTKVTLGPRPGTAQAK